MQLVISDGTIATTESDLKCRNFNVSAIFGHFGQNWPILSTIEIVVAGKILVLDFWPLIKVRK